MNYYIALRFKGRPDVHMTLEYCHRADNQRSLASLIARVGEKIGQLSPRKFRMKLDLRVTMGWKTKVEALTPSEVLPSWVYELTKHGWIPHVTTTEENLDLLVDAVAIMMKQTEIYRWELSE